METCVICRNKFESESPAILFVSGYGSRRCLCPECESLLDLATAEESEEQAKAKEELLTRATAMKDAEAVRVLQEVLSGDTVATVTPEEEAEMNAIFEEVRAEEAEEETKTPLWANVLPVVVIGVFALFLVWFYFLR